MRRLDQFDYEMLRVKDRWYVGEAIDMLISVEMDMKGYFLREDRGEIFEKISRKYWTCITDVMSKGLLPYVTHHEPEDIFMYDEGVDPSKCIREFNTSFSKEVFLQCVIDNKNLNVDVQALTKFLTGEVLPEAISLPEVPPERIVFEKVYVLRGESTNNVILNEFQSDDEVASNANHYKVEEVAESKYPDFKGLKVDGLTNEQLTELKQYYGIVKAEESKLRRAIPIAVKIGLLFYERSLGKPTTKSAFLNAYKKEFDAILKNDVLAKDIYRSLPEEYRGGRSTADNSFDVLSIIKAAVYAGSIYDTDDVKDLGKLKADLVVSKYPVPSDDILLKIIEVAEGI